ncbi:hypothetical protein ACFT5B_07895 [Luteimicrobium sp. NPDC057192]|uniref:hypothetical protein n=1 Tax=Luteimicrobium sp. NPDC057192 TaxID=3346042 RepID=UPI00362C0A8D
MNHPSQNDVRPRSIDRRHGRIDRRVYVRRRIAVGVAAGLLAILVVLFLAFAWPGLARSDASPAPTVTVTQPGPSPTAQPAALPAGATAFVQATPGLVGPWARTATRPAGAGSAIEAWVVTYAGPYDGADTKITVGAWQYETAAEAAGAAAARTGKGAEPSASGDVVVRGKKAGTYAVVPGSDGNAQVVWSNGTAVFDASGPADAVRSFYFAFPL